jgi:hypothetical protein
MAGSKIITILDYIRKGLYRPVETRNHGKLFKR